MDRPANLVDWVTWLSQALELPNLVVIGLGVFAASSLCILIGAAAAQAFTRER